MVKRIGCVNKPPSWGATWASTYWNSFLHTFMAASNSIYVHYVRLNRVIAQKLAFKSGYTLFQTLDFSDKVTDGSLHLAHSLVQSNKAKALSLYLFFFLFIFFE